MSEATKLNKSLVNAVQNRKVKPMQQDKKDPHFEVEGQVISRIGYHY